MSNPFRLTHLNIALIIIFATGVAVSEQLRYYRWLGFLGCIMGIILATYYDTHLQGRKK